MGATSSGGDDFFGTNYIGINPYQQDDVQTAGGIQQKMGSSVSDGSLTGAPHSGTAPPSPAANVPNASKGLTDPSGGSLMDPAYMQSLLNYWQQQPGVNPSVINDPGYWTQKATQGAFGNDQSYLESRFMTPEGPPAGQAIRGTPFNYSGVNIPPDLQPLRTLISNNLAQNFGNAPKTYGGNFNLPTPGGYNQLLANAGGITDQVGGMMQPGLDALGGLLGFGGSSDLSPLYGPLAQLLGGGTGANINPFLQQGTSFLNAMQPQAAGMAATGGVNAQMLQQLLPSLMGMGSNMLPGANSLMRGGIGSSLFGDASNMVGQANNTFGTAQGVYGNAQNVLGGAQNLFGGAGGTFANAGGMASNIAATGGAPMQQLIKSLGDIQTAGQGNIDRNLAQIREQYGMQGLGTGSDVNTALALGATQGQQAIEAQQSSLLSQILQQASGVQLGGVNALLGAGSGQAGVAQGVGGIGNILANIGGGIAGIGSGQLGAAGQLSGIGGQWNAAQQAGLGALGTAGGLQLGGAQSALTGSNNQSNAQLAAIQALLGGANAATGQGGLAVQNAGLMQQGMLGGLNSGLNILSTPFNQSLQSAQMQLNAAMGFPTFGNAMTGAYGTANSGLLGAGQLNQQGNLYSNQGNYTDFLRTIGLTPQQQAAMGYSTSYPPVVPATPSAGTQLGGAAIGAGGSIFASLLPFLLGFA